MKTKINKLICYFFDHKYNQVALDHGYYECFRCGRWDYVTYLSGNEGYEWFSKKTWYIRRVIKNCYCNSLWKIQQWKSRKNGYDDVPF